MTGLGVGRGGVVRGGIRDGGDEFIVEGAVSVPVQKAGFANSCTGSWFCRLLSHLGVAGLGAWLWGRGEMDLLILRVGGNQDGVRGSEEKGGVG